MSDAQSTLPPVKESIKIHPGIALEYETLRNEIIKRLEMRQKIMELTMTIAGIFIGLGIKTDSIAMLYPLLAIFLAAAWVQNDLRITDIGNYIRDHIENKILDLEWETTVQNKRVLDASEGKFRSTILAHGGIFIISQIIAMGVGLSFILSFTLVDKVLFWADMVSLLVVIFIFTLDSRV